MTKKHTLSKAEWDSIHRAIARLRADVMSVVFGMIGGITLFLATIWLVLRGPTSQQEVVGPHLGLLNNYFPGYEVTVLGAFIGLFYGALTGAVVGWIISFVYNSVADKRKNELEKL
jgi:hypothetical protein